MSTFICSFVSSSATCLEEEKWKHKHRSHLYAAPAAHYPDIPAQTECYDHFSVACANRMCHIFLLSNLALMPSGQEWFQNQTAAM